MAAPTVHVIDDDDAVRDSLALLLDAEGLTVVTYASAEVFLDSVVVDFHGCVLADVQMAGLNGVELLSRLNDRGLSPPVVLMTGRPGADLSARALSAGAAALLDKPFSSEALLEALRAAIAAAS